MVFELVLEGGCDAVWLLSGCGISLALVMGLIALVWICPTADRPILFGIRSLIPGLLVGVIFM